MKVTVVVLSVCVCYTLAATYPICWSKCCYASYDIFYIMYYVDFIENALVTDYCSAHEKDMQTTTEFSAQVYNTICDRI